MGVMTKDAQIAAPPTADILAMLASIGGALDSDIAIVSDRLPELRRQARADPKRRGGAGSADAAKYSLGSTLTLLGLASVDPDTLTGFFARFNVTMRWMATLQHERGPLPFGELVTTALADPSRARWCRAWGVHLQWQYRKPLYDAAVSSFLASGRTGPKEKWRTLDVSDDQAALITIICRLRALPMPDFVTRGEAFEWIYEHGGNPDYWGSPAMPDDWKE